MCLPWMWHCVTGVFHNEEEGGAMLSHGLFKRIAALSFALALLFGLAACGDDDSDASADTQTSETTESEDQATDEDSADDEDSGETGEKPDWAKEIGRASCRERGEITGVGGAAKEKS